MHRIGADGRRWQSKPACPKRSGDVCVDCIVFGYLEPWFVHQFFHCDLAPPCPWTAGASETLSPNEWSPGLKLAFRLLARCMVRPHVARGKSKTESAVLQQCIRPQIGAVGCRGPSWICAQNAVPLLRHIILNDDKSSTYKLALSPREPCGNRTAGTLNRVNVARSAAAVVCHAGTTDISLDAGRWEKPKPRPCAT